MGPVGHHVFLILEASPLRSAAQDTLSWAHAGPGCFGAWPVQWPQLIWVVTFQIQRSLRVTGPRTFLQDRKDEGPAWGPKAGCRARPSQALPTSQMDTGPPICLLAMSCWASWGGGSLHPVAMSSFTTVSGCLWLPVCVG